MEKNLNLLKDMLDNQTDQIVQEMKHIYVKAMTSALSMITTGMVEFLYYKDIFGRDQEKTLNFIYTLIDRCHVDISKSLIDSTSNSEEFEIFKEEMSAITSDIQKVMEESLKEIKKGLRDDLDRAILQFTGACDTRDTGKSGD